MGLGYSIPDVTPFPPCLCASVYKVGIGKSCHVKRLLEDLNNACEVLRSSNIGHFDNRINVLNQSQPQSGSSVGAM